MDVDDPDHAAKAFEESTLPIDLEHREKMARVLGERVKAELVYECVTQPDR
jgi:hypothetical protein